MSEGFSGYNNAKFSNVVNVNSLDYYEHLNSGEETSEEINFSYDHLYSSNTENDEVVALDRKQNCQTAESEVKFLKEWLILHLDLIQQQNDEILSKEKTILILQQENEMLKERISCMERGAPFQPSKHLLNDTEPEYLEEAFSIDMTHDSVPCEDDNKERIQLLEIDSSNGVNCALPIVECQLDNVLSDSDSQTGQVRNEINNSNTVNLNLADIQQKSEVNTNFVLKTLEGDNPCDPNCAIQESELDPMRTLRMSIRRKRVCSNSSALSSNSTAEEKGDIKRSKKRRKRDILTTSEPYVTQAGGELHLGRLPDPEPTNTNTTLEVPRWRVKVYASCYSMEGTENLDDEVFIKRHSRLEYDEKRRKKWDIQRIREQRVVEKLKLREEKISGVRTEVNDCPKSFWPKLEDVKFLEVCSELPVSAFGYPIPKIIPSEFSLPWLNNPAIDTKKYLAKGQQ